MKIAILGPDGLTILLFCKGLIRTLQSRQHEVVVIPGDRNYTAEIESLGVRSTPVELYRYLGPFEDLRYLAKVYRAFRRERFDAVINVTSKTVIYGPIAARLAGVKKVVNHILGLGTAFLPTEAGGRTSMRRIALPMYRLGCRLSDRVWFTNANDLDSLKTAGAVDEAKAIVTRFYLDTDFYAPSAVCEQEIHALRKQLQLGGRDTVVLMVARLIWPKGVREFVEASELLLDRHPSLKFVLVAPPENGSPTAVPESYVKTRERNRNFRWVPFSEDVRPFYAMADIAVLPSYYREGGYPRTLLEPMAMGKALIAANSADCRGPVEEGKNGLLVPVKDSGALAAAVLELANDRDKRERFGRHSRLRAELDFSEREIIPAALRQLDLL